MKKKEKKRPVGNIAKNIAQKAENAVSLKNLWLFIILIAMALFTLTTLVASMLSKLVTWLIGVDFELSLYGWTILFSVLIGACLSIIIGKALIVPVVKLSAAMKRVAKGDFGVRLEYGAVVNEINTMIENFNIMARELSATEVLQSDFVSNVSHEFKTPLSVIEGYATLLQDECVSDAERKDYAEKIVLNSRRLSDLVGNVLLLSKLENQNIPSAFSSFKLDEQIRQCIVMLQPKIENKNLELDVKLSETDYCGNQSLLQHVWTNLLDNAIKFNRKGGLLTVILECQSGLIIVRIADEGEGVSEEGMKHIYDKFYQGDSSHRGEGNGLGLSLVKRIIDTHGGSIVCRNLESGGAEFTVTLPIAVN